MKKDRNNKSDRSLGLPRERILRGRTNFQRLFNDSSVNSFYNKHIAIRFYVLEDRSRDIKMGFIVSKKHGKATRRNRVKRLLREAYRLNQHMLADVISAASLGFHGVLIARTANIDFDIANIGVVDLLDCVRTYMYSSFTL